MKNKQVIFCLCACLSIITACKKDTPVKQIQVVQTHTLETGLINLSVKGQLVDAVIDTTLNTVTVTVPRAADMHNLTVNYTLASQVNATLNNTPLSSGTVVDFSKPLTLTVTSADAKRYTSFRLVAQTELGYFGLPGQIMAEKSLNKSYDFYIDQWDGSQFEAINCGPTVSTMAMKWADSTFARTPVDARKQIQPFGGWWNTGEVESYLRYYGVNTAEDTLSNMNVLIKTNIDKGNLIILCLDMYYAEYNDLSYQHVNKFYPTATTGWGHFLLVKGYKVIDNNLYLEIYDPYSGGQHYSSISTDIKGKDRYYFADDIKIATNKWWPYAIVVAPRGKSVTTVDRLKINSLSKPIPLASGQ